MNRLFEIFVSAVGLVILSPVILVAAVAVKISSPGPVIHRASRAGREGRSFILYKFRTMVVDADQHGPGITSAQDQRITRVGRWLRKTKIDELPQLFNVLKGDMSLVGPRPEDPRYVDLYTPEQRRVLDVRPGITSLASVRYSREEELLTGADWENTYIKTVMPDKLSIELEYLAHRSFWRDLKILWKTARCLFH